MAIGFNHSKFKSSFHASTLLREALALWQVLGSHSCILGFSCRLHKLALASSLTQVAVNKVYLYLQLSHDQAAVVTVAHQRP